MSGKKKHGPVSEMQGPAQKNHGPVPKKTSMSNTKAAITKPFLTSEQKEKNRILFRTWFRKKVLLFIDPLIRTFCGGMGGFHVTLFLVAVAQNVVQTENELHAFCLYLLQLTPFNTLRQTKSILHIHLIALVREAAKKVIFFMAMPLRP